MPIQLFRPALLHLFQKLLDFDWLTGELEEIYEWVTLKTEST